MPANAARRSSLSFTRSFDFSDERGRTKAAKTAAPLCRCRTRSASPPVRKGYEWEEFSRIDEVDEDEVEEDGGAASKKGRRWSLKEFLYRSISEGRGRAREKEMERERLVQAAVRAEKKKQPGSKKVVDHNSKKLGGLGAEVAPPPRSRAPSASKAQLRDAVSAHERYYSANRAQAAEMKKKTFLPYRNGLLGWLGPFQNTQSGNHHVVPPAS